METIWRFVERQASCLQKSGFVLHTRTVSLDQHATRLAFQDHAEKVSTFEEREGLNISSSSQNTAPLYASRARAHIDKRHRDVAKPISGDAGIDENGRTSPPRLYTQALGSSGHGGATYDLDIFESLPLTRYFYKWGTLLLLLCKYNGLQHPAPPFPTSASQ